MFAASSRASYLICRPTFLPYVILLEAKPSTQMQQQLLANSQTPNNALFASKPATIYLRIGTTGLLLFFLFDSNTQLTDRFKSLTFAQSTKTCNSPWKFGLRAHLRHSNNLDRNSDKIAWAHAQDVSLRWSRCVCAGNSTTFATNLHLNCTISLRSVDLPVCCESQGKMSADLWWKLWWRLQNCPLKSLGTCNDTGD